jgi:hypothetical protein
MPPSAAKGQLMKGQLMTHAFRAFTGFPAALRRKTGEPSPSFPPAVRGAGPAGPEGGEPAPSFSSAAREAGPAGPEGGEPAPFLSSAARGARPASPERGEPAPSFSPAARRARPATLGSGARTMRTSRLASLLRWWRRLLADGEPADHASDFGGPDDPGAGRRRLVTHAFFLGGVFSPAEGAVGLSRPSSRGAYDSDS